MKKSKTSDLLTITLAASKLKVSRQNIYQAIERGRLKASRVGSVLLLSLADLDRYGKSRQHTGRPPKKK
jgi:excisionase family DNA binding protein